MAQGQIVTLEDDIHGGEANPALRFGFSGSEYEIDLNDKNASKMQQAFTFYIDHARRVSGWRRPTSSRGRTSSTGVDSREVRAWAASNGVELSSRGRIPVSVIEQYRDAGN